MAWRLWFLKFRVIISTHVRVIGDQRCVEGTKYVKDPSPNFSNFPNQVDDRERVFVIYFWILRLYSHPGHP